MKKDSDKFNEVLHLLVQSDSDLGDDGQVDRLNEMLRSDSGLRLKVAQYLQDESLLLEELAISGASDMLKQHFSSAGYGESIPSEPNETVAALTRRNPLSRSYLMAMSAFATGVALSLMISIGWMSPYSGHEDRAPRAGIEIDHDGAGSQRADFKSGSLSMLPKQLEPEAKQSSLGFITLVKDCEWRTPRSLGDQLDAGKLELVQGLARINFINGVAILLQAPAELHLKSADHVVVSRGDVLVSVSEQAIGFRLETPTTSVIDVGTEFSVSVNAEGKSELEVLEGAVTCLPLEGQAQADARLITAGTATLFESRQDHHGRQATSRLEELREFRDSVTGSEDSKLLVYETFDYTEGKLGSESGGYGWASPWLRGFKHNLDCNALIRSGHNLHPPQWFRGDSTTYAVQPWGLSSRQLQHPLDLSVDADYFVSFLMRKRSLSSDPNVELGAGIKIFSDEDRRHGVGVSFDQNSRVTGWTGGKRYRSGSDDETEIDAEKTYFVVMKISARSEDKDNVKVCVFSDSVPFEVLEPDSWSVVGKPAHLDWNLNRVGMWCQPSVLAFIDEIRVGTSWESVIPLM